MPAHLQSNTAAQASSATERPRTLDPQRSAPPLRVLVIEDDPPVRDACLEIARGMGFATTTADSLNSARAVLPQPVDIVLLDVRLPGGDGLSLLDEIRTRHPSAIVIIMTAYATVDSAVEALRIGAGDYLAKPFTLEELTSTLERAAERRDRLRTGRGQGRLTGRSPGMEKLYRILSKVAFTTHPVLIVGESGTGKSVVAQTIHLNGPRASEPFYTVECSALSPDAMEAQLFGGPEQAALLAQTGTLFLDEVSDLPPDLQGRLLR